MKDSDEHRQQVRAEGLRAAAQRLTAADIADFQWRDEERRRKLRPPANWAKWSHVPRAELWQCVALSVGIEPVAAIRLVIGWFVANAEPRPKPWFAIDDYADMLERLDIALANAGCDELSSLHPLPQPSAEMVVRLFSTAEFGRWARSLGWEIPTEFPGSNSKLTIENPEPAARCVLPVSPPAEASSTVQMPSGAATPAVTVPAVVAADDAPLPLPLTTGDIAFCFDGLRYSETQWKKPLGDKPKWLAACIAIPGRRGVSETRWNPVLIGGALVRAGHVQPHRVRARFQSKPMLTPWLDAWKTYEADYIESA